LVAVGELVTNHDRLSRPRRGLFNTPPGPLVATPPDDGASIVYDYYMAAKSER